jgi:hypothetical protein
MLDKTATSLTAADAAKPSLKKSLSAAADLGAALNSPEISQECGSTASRTSRTYSECSEDEEFGKIND